MLAEPNARQLHQALELRAAGARIEEATGLHSSTPALERLLAVAESVAALPMKPAPVPGRAVIRERFVQEGARRRHAWVHASGRIRHRAGRHPAPTHHGRWMLVTAAGVLVALIAGPLVAFAAMTAYPESPLYPVRLAGERVLLATTRDRVGKSQVKVDIAGQRFRDAEETASHGNGDLTVAAMKAYFAALSDAGSGLAAVDRHDAAWKKARDHFATAEAKPIDVVIRDLNRHKLTAAAAEVTAQQKAFNAERQDLDKALTITPSAKPGATGPVQGATQDTTATP